MTQQEAYADASRSTYRDTGGGGWITFAGVMIVIVAIFTLDVLVLYGLVAHGGRPALN